MFGLRRKKTKNKMKTLSRILIVVSLGLPMLYTFFKKEGRYTVQTGYSIFEFPLTTDTIAEDTIQHKITFTDLNFHNKYIMSGNYVIVINEKKN